MNAWWRYRGAGVLAAAALLSGCDWEPRPFDVQVETAAAQPPVHALLRTHGCVHCHTIEGVPGANGRVGPSLAGFEHRRVFAGGQPNGEAELTRFLLDPRSVSPGTAMPATVTDPQQAARIAAWLLGRER